MDQTRTVKMVYCATLTYISCPVSAKYDDFIQIAMKRFAIPNELKDFIRVYAGHKFVFSKNGFDMYLRHYPNPEIAFDIRVDNFETLDNLDEHHRAEAEPTNRNRKNPRDDEDLEFFEKCDAEQPSVKRMRIDCSNRCESMEY